MLVRTSPHIFLDLPQKLQSTITTLKEELENPTPNALTVRNTCIHILFRIWSRAWQKSDNNPLGDPTIVFLALSMLKHDGSFQTPKNTTPLVAKLKYGLRLIMLVILKRVATTESIDDMKSCERYEKWFTEKVDSTFNTICTLQHYASSLAHPRTRLASCCVDGSHQSSNNAVQGPYC